MIFYYLFMAGLMVGDFSTPKAKVVVIDNGQIVQEVQSPSDVLLVKNGAVVEMRVAKERKPHEKELIMNKVPMAFRRDVFGGFTMDCHECMEDKPQEADTVSWTSAQ